MSTARKLQPQDNLLRAQKEESAPSLLARQAKSVAARFSYEQLTANIPFLLFLAGMAMLYIWNSYYAENNHRRINHLDRELKELRWEYMASKAQLMHRSKQSELAKLAAPMGLKELTEPPHKIVIKQGEY